MKRSTTSRASVAVLALGSFSLDADAQRFAATARARSPRCESSRTFLRGHVHCIRQLRSFTECASHQRAGSPRRIQNSRTDSAVDRLSFSRRLRFRARAARLNRHKSNRVFIAGNSVGHFVERGSHLCRCAVFTRLRLNRERHNQITNFEN